MARRSRYNPRYAAGVLIQDPDGCILGVSRQPPPRKLPRGSNHTMYDWGLPGGLDAPTEDPPRTAARELYEETGLTSPSGLLYLLTVPPEIAGGRGIPYHVFYPAGPVAGAIKKSTKEGRVAWVKPQVFIGTRDPQLSVAMSNRYILYWGLGIA